MFYVLYSASKGVFLGTEGTHNPLWSNEGPSTPDRHAQLFEQMFDGTRLEQFYEQEYGGHVPEDSRMIQVQCKNGISVSRDECVAAGLPSWGQSYAELAAERNRLLAANRELTHALDRLVESSVTKDPVTDKSGRTTPTWTAIVNAEDAIKLSKDLVAEIDKSNSSSTQLVVERDGIKAMNSKLLQVLCRTLEALESADMSKIPGLYDAVPWADIENLLAQSKSDPRVMEPIGGTPLNEYQRTIADFYESGQFSRVLTIEDVEEIGKTKDSVFAFLIAQAGENLESIELSDVVDRIEVVETAARHAISHLQDAHGTSPASR